MWSERITAGAPAGAGVLMLAVQSTEMPFPASWGSEIRLSRNRHQRHAALLSVHGVLGAYLFQPRSDDAPIRHDGRPRRGKHFPIFDRDLTLQALARKIRIDQHRAGKSHRAVFADVALSSLFCRGAVD